MSDWIRARVYRGSAGQSSGAKDRPSNSSACSIFNPAISSTSFHSGRTCTGRSNSPARSSVWCATCYVLQAMWPGLNWSRGFEPLQFPCSVLNTPRAHFGTLRTSTTMFVRWQEYKSQAKSRRLRAFRKKHGQHRLRAMLVETVRIDGKPHQRYLAYLGSLQAERRDRPRVWSDVTRKLDQCRLSREERNR